MDILTAVLLQAHNIAPAGKACPVISIEESIALAQLEVEPPSTEL